MCPHFFGERGGPCKVRGCRGPTSDRHAMDHVLFNHAPLFFPFRHASKVMQATLNRLWEYADEDLRTLFLQLMPGPAESFRWDHRKHLVEHLTQFKLKRASLRTFNASAPLRNLRARRLLRERLATLMSRGKSQTLLKHMKATRQFSLRRPIKLFEQESLRQILRTDLCCTKKGCFHTSASKVEAEEHLKEHTSSGNFFTWYIGIRCCEFNLLPARLWYVHPKSSGKSATAPRRRQDSSSLFMRPLKVGKRTSERLEAAPDSEGGNHSDGSGDESDNF